MKYKIFGLLIAFSLSFASISLAQTLTTKKDSVSYSVGIIVADNLKKQGVGEVDPKIVAKAVEDIINEGELMIPKAEANTYFKQYLREQKAMLGEANKLAGEEFLAENAKRPEVVTLESGLQYEVLTEGEGPKPNPNSRVRTHYHGTLIDGTIFDSSVQRGEPISFGLNQVIRAWQEALPLMNVGSKYRIFSPYNLAYGERGAGPVIKPFSALIFEIELLGIE